VEPDLIEPAAETAPSRRRRALLGGIAVLVAGALLASAWPDGPRPVAPSPAAAADTSVVTIVAGEPASIDPAKHGDLGSASYVSQLFESLTAVDPQLVIRPALAESWVVASAPTSSSATARRSLPRTSSTAGAACSPRRTRRHSPR